MKSIRCRSKYPLDTGRHLTPFGRGCLHCYPRSLNTAVFIFMNARLNFFSVLYLVRLLREGPIKKTATRLSGLQFEEMSAHLIR